MKNNSELIQEFADMGSRYAFSLKDGTYYEGYILDINESNFEFGIGGPMAPSDSIHIEYEHLDYGSLSFFDKKDKCYKNAVWSQVENQWLVS